jgi:Mce-associated membrane protein
MTPRSGAAGRGNNEPEKESDAVRTDTVDSRTDEGLDTLAEESTFGVENDTAASEPDEDISDEVKPKKPRFAISLPRLVAFGVLPFVVLLLGVAGAYLKWESASIRAAQVSDVEAVGVAKDATVAMLSYQPDTVDKDLGAARDRMTGTFKDSYTQLTHDVVIPGAKQRHISAVATVPAAAAASATANHAVVLVFVNQTVVVGNDAPTATASSVRVTLDRVGGRWLVSGFDPV